MFPFFSSHFIYFIYSTVQYCTQNITLRVLTSFFPIDILQGIQGFDVRSYLIVGLHKDETVGDLLLGFGGISSTQGQ